MGTFEKLISKIFSGGQVSYKEAEKILLKLGFDLQIMSSHHIFRKKGYGKNISLKKRAQLLPYQIRDIKKVLVDHGYEK